MNLVWNYVNDLSFKVWERERRFVSAFDLPPYVKGASNAGLNLHSQTLQTVTEEFVTRRKQFKKLKLRWRVSNPKRSNYSLGWIPFKAVAPSTTATRTLLDVLSSAVWSGSKRSSPQLRR